MPNSAHPADRYGETLQSLLQTHWISFARWSPIRSIFPTHLIKSPKNGFRAVFDHMYSVCNDPAFDITDIAHSKQASYLRWRMTGKLKSWPYTDLNFEGMTEVRCDTNGLITHHIDHWDSASQLLQHLPIIGLFTRVIRRLFKLPNN